MHINYVKWLYGVAYGGKPFFTGTATPPEGYVKKQKKQLRRLFWKNLFSIKKVFEVI